MTATSQETSEKRMPQCTALVALAEPVVRQFGSISGWKGEATRFTNVHAGGIVGWLNREVLPEPKSFTLASEVILGEIMDQVYSAC